MFYDMLVFNKVKEMLGGRVKLMSTGSAPINPETLSFLKVCLGTEIFEGYGMTETTAYSVITQFGDNGVTGGPLFNVKLKLKDIPDMNYYSTDSPPRGEICFWGPSVMKGYFMNPEKTKEAFTEDGWLLSGDVGEIGPNGSVRIIDRAKNIFKLSQGEYIAPEKLENVYVQAPFVMQCWIYGDSLRDHIIGFFVVDPEVVKKWAAANGKSENLGEIIKDE